MISFVAFGLIVSVAWADGPFARGAVGAHVGYIVSEKYAEEHKADIIASIPDLEKIDGFWTPPEQDVAVADRVFRELIHSAVKDPTLLFPGLSQNADPGTPDSLEYQRNELALISDNYDRYSRQYVGIIIDGTRFVFCNYSDGPKFDPSADYIFIQKVFVPGGTVHFLQCRFEPWFKICSHVSIVGSWQPQAK
jgi:hypothetical protein